MDKKKELLKKDKKYVSPSYTRPYPLVVNSGNNMYVYDVNGKEYLDFTAGIATCSTGHCHKSVVQAIKDQSEKLIHMSGTDFYYESQILLAEKLNEILSKRWPVYKWPGKLKHSRLGSKTVWKSYFCNSGAEAIEAAIKLARYHTERPLMIAFQGAFHGRTMGALSLTASKTVQKSKFSPLLPQVFHFPYKLESIYEIESAFKSYIPPREVAAIFVEPIQGEGGYVVPTYEFHQRLYELTRKYGILYVVDEIQTGMGRTGKMFGIEHFGVKPDIVCMAKGIASGMPLGVMSAPSYIMNWKPGSHASTFGGNPISCAAAIATIDLLENELIENSKKMGEYLRDKLKGLAGEFSSIRRVRGKGLMVAITVHSIELRDKIIQKAYENGILLLGCGEDSIRFCPPLTVKSWQIDTMISVLRDIVFRSW